MFSTIMNKMKEFMQVKRNKTIVTICLIVVCFFAFNLGGLLGEVFTSITSIFSSDNKEVKQVIFKSDGYDSEEDGSFKVVKQADWTSTNTAQITFTVDSIMEADIIKKDIIVVLDTSASMKGSRINNVNNALKELFETVLEEEGNKFALIEFNDTAKVLTDFTDNKTTLNNLLDNITPKGETNYNQALLRVGDIMSDYTKSNDREVKVIFITDGLPNVEHPNQNATYEELKDDYPYLTIHAIQYGISDSIVYDVQRISDYAYLASYFLNTLLQISYSPVGYETFEIVDYIDNTYFEVKDEKDIKVSIGNVSLTNENGVQKITWTVPSGTFKTGSSHTLKIDISLKDAYTKKEGLYSTNKETNIKIKLPEHGMIEMTTTETPKLKNPYTVTYVANAPDGCSATIDLTETHYAYETVSFTGTKLSCDGYTFAGWEVDLEEKTMVNSESFIMPPHDIIVKGIWTKLDISKNMGGEVYEKLTLYNTIARQAVADNIASKYVTSATGINFSAISSDTNGKGVYTISSTLNNTYPIHYFRGDIENNHVIFGGFCWEIVMTTETGGVKLIYDGTPTNGACNNTGEKSQLSETSQINPSHLSPAYMGYMYNTVYTYSNAALFSSVRIFNKNESMAGTSYYYGTSATYNGSTYTLGSASAKAWDSNYSSLSGYYTCLNATTSCATVYYVLAGHDTYAYLLPLSSGKTITTETMTLGSSLTENTNGIYTLTGTTTIRKIDWYNNYGSYDGYYMCSDYSSTTCSNVYYLYSPYIDYSLINSSSYNYIYGNSFTYDETTSTYTLSNTKKIWKYYTDYPALSNYHYTCFNTTGTCNTVYYIFYADEYAWNIRLSDGKSVEDALNEMLWADDVNTNNSTIKTVIDNWYKENLVNYTSYLENTIWCNDRSSNNLGGWSPNGNIRTWLTLNGGSGLGCKNVTDQFTLKVSSGGTIGYGNNKLDYPVGLLTASEIWMSGGAYYNANTNYYLYTGTSYHTMSPTYIYRNNTAYSHVANNGAVESAHGIIASRGVRPMVSLKPGIMYTKGNGTEENPYVIDLSS